jgi:hypothetical protein
MTEKIELKTFSSNTNETNASEIENLEENSYEYYNGDNDDYIHYEDTIEDMPNILDKKKSLSLGSFDEKDELLANENDLLTQQKIVSASSSKSFVRSISSGLNAANDLTPPNLNVNNINLNNGKNGSKKGKSQFYLPDSTDSNIGYNSTQLSYSQHSSMSDLFNGLAMLPRNIFKEKPIVGLHNVTCVYSTNYLDPNTLRADCVNVPGRLLLTNFKLAFLPYAVKYDSNKLFTVDHKLELFRNTHSPLDFVLPLSFVYDIKACKSYVKFLLFFFRLSLLKKFNKKYKFCTKLLKRFLCLISKNEIYLKEKI